MGKPTKAKQSSMEVDHLSVGADLKVSSLMTPISAQQSDWLGLMIGNSRLHWAWFQANKLVQTWDSQHLATVAGQLPKSILPSNLEDKFSGQIPLYFASVVPQQTEIYQTYPHAQQISKKDLPLGGIYATMGVDRALSSWGAGVTYGFPCLVIDGGTALTFTGVNDQKTLVGGAILPGVKLQLQSLAQKTAALPEISLPQRLPRRWARQTPEAIASGVVFSILAAIKSFIENWQQKYPRSPVILTGGDAELLLRYLQFYDPPLAARVTIDANLIFWGMRSLKYLS